MTTWRKSTWAFALWNALMLLWAATNLNGIGDCTGESGSGLVVCEIGRSVGVEFGFALIATVWVIGLLVFGLIWLLTRRGDA